MGTVHPVKVSGFYSKVNAFWIKLQRRVPASLHGTLLWIYFSCGPEDGAGSAGEGRTLGSVSALVPPTQRYYSPLLLKPAPPPPLYPDISGAVNQPHVPSMYNKLNLN